MKIIDLLQHYGMISNPFAEEDAQTDPVFKDSCIKTTRHPVWDKLYGTPQDPSTSLIFGEKGSGKTALRMQMLRELSLYNGDHPSSSVFVLDYSDMNPYLDRFRCRYSRHRKMQKVLNNYRLEDHLDALLSIGVTQYVDRVLNPTQCTWPAAVDSKAIDLSSLSEAQVRDLLALAIVYDQCRGESPYFRFQKLLKKTHAISWKSFFVNLRELGLGVLGSMLFLLPLFRYGWYLHYQWILLFLLISWSPFLWKILCRGFRAWRAVSSLRVIRPEWRDVFSALSQFTSVDYSSLVLPAKGSSENRYDLLSRFLSLLEKSHFNGILVFIDRIDEPYLINGSPDLMKAVIWPLLDNKILKYEKVGFKCLLPDVLYRYMEKERPEFHERARLDKQNVISSLAWSGEALFDLVNARMSACTSSGEPVSILAMFNGIERRRLVEAFGQLRVPRHLFKFLYRLLMKHANSFSEEAREWKISASDFESTLALYLRDREVAEREGSGLC